MQAFATVNDLELGWKTLTPGEQAVANELLLRASAQLVTLLSNHGITVDSEDEAQAINLKTVTCNMVRRSMNSGGSYDGVSSVSQTIGSTVAAVQWSNPDGSFYLSKSDKESLGLLGVGKLGYASTVDWNEVGDAVR